MTMSLVSELRRRNVFRMAALYLGVAWLIVQVVDVLEDPLRLPDWTASALLAVLVIGFPIALALSWFYELTPEGVTLDEDVKPDTLLPAAGRRVDFIIIAVMAAALLLFAYDKWWTGPPPDRSVAVLPFVAMSSGEDDGYFSDGLTEEILNSLAQLPELQVTARTSSFFFKGKDVPIAEIAAVLGVAHIVEGSVRRDGERLRITSQLIRAADGFHLWSQTYDRANEDIFKIQEDIAENVAEVLNVVLDDEARERMQAIQLNDVEAFIAYQKGLEYFQKAHNAEVDFFEGLAIAKTHFDEAIEAQPNLLAARLLRADPASHRLRGMISNEEPDMDKVKDQFEALRNELDEAWRAAPSGNQRDILKLERTLVSDDWTGLSTVIRRAMQPGSCPRINFAEVIQEIGFAHELALKLEESLACNPLDTDVITRLATAYTSAGRADESLKLLDRAEAAGVNSARFDSRRFFALIVAGQFDGLEAQDYRGREVSQYLVQGNQASAQQLAEQSWADPDFGVVRSLNIAAMVGDRARANAFAARIDKYPGSAGFLVGSLGYCRDLEGVVKATGCRHGVPFDLSVTPNLKARIEESGLQWPPVTYRQYVD